MTSSIQNMYDLDTSTGIITITALGRRDFETTEDSMRGIETLRRYLAQSAEGAKILVDFRRVRAANAETAEAIINAHKAMDFLAMAAVYRDEWQRTFLDFIATHNGKADRTRIFNSMRDAHEWLVKQPRTMATCNNQH